MWGRAVTQIALPYSSTIRHHKPKVILMDSRAQVSIEYLLTLLFAIMLVIAASVLAISLQNSALVAQKRVIDAREETINSLMG